MVRVISAWVEVLGKGRQGFFDSAGINVKFKELATPFQVLKVEIVRVTQTVFHKWLSRACCFQNHAGSYSDSHTRNHGHVQQACQCKG